MKKAFGILSGVCVIMLLGILTAQAAGPTGLFHNLKHSSSFKFLSEGDPTLAPMAHVVFCIRQPMECKPSDGPNAVSLSEGKMEELRALNRRVNQAIVPYMPPGIETWIISPERGNCHDYAVTKRHELIEKGWPSRALRLAVAYTDRMEGHAILIVHTDSGDFVLDNRTNDIKSWSATDLQIVKLQSAEDPKLWVSLSFDRPSSKVELGDKMLASD